MAEMYLILIETSGNQNYIFSTNKLKENIGASELTYRAGTTWVLDAIADITNSQVWKNCQDSDRLRSLLLNPEINPGSAQVEVILAASGKALLLTESKEDAQKIIKSVTKRAIIEAPGLEVCGVFIEFDWYKENLSDINEKVHRLYEKVRSLKPSSDLRFLRLPVVDQCATSGLPAKCLDNENLDESNLDNTKNSKPISALAESKRQASKKGFSRLRNIPRKKDSKLRLPDSTNEMERKIEEEFDWFAVIHADGNGLGDIFRNFHEHIDYTKFPGKSRNRVYVDELRKFSLALDICTENAFTHALSVFPSQPDSIIPLVPLILGGDDLTVVCDGKFAIPFTHAFLEAFEHETQQAHPKVENVIAEIAVKALNADRLSACAGIAIIKPHFPFSVAYELAEALMKVAKDVKKYVKHPETGKPYPCSAFDFHILYDSSDVKLDNIRGKLRIEDTIYLYNRPYVVTPIEELQAAISKEWAEFHHWDHLQRRANALLKKSSEAHDRRALPNSQIHDLRAGLFLGKEQADQRYRLIKDRYSSSNIHLLEGDPGSLFAKQHKTEIYVTALMDAIDASEFLGGEPNE